MTAPKALIFDLDGTLIDSLQDIADAMNRILIAKALPTHSYPSYQEFIGRGLKNMVERCLPPDMQTEALLESYHLELLREYSEHAVIKTCLYPGIRELLEEISRYYPMAILSNKADEITQPIAQKLGLTAYFDLILGATPRFPRKPDIQSSLYLAKQLGCLPNEILYVGDSGVDMQTAKKAGMIAVGVSWGFRSREELIEKGADFLVNTPEEILRILERIQH